VNAIVVVARRRRTADEGEPQVLPDGDDLDVVGVHQGEQLAHLVEALAEPEHQPRLGAAAGFEPPGELDQAQALQQVGPGADLAVEPPDGLWRPA
jgi:hypothetical protein